MDTTSNSGSGGLLGETIELTAGTGGVTAYVNATKSATLTGSSAADTFMLVSDAASGSTSSFVVDLGSGSAADSAADKVMIDYSFEMSGSATIEIKNIGSGDTTNVAKATVESLTVAKALGVINGAFTSLNATSGDVTAYSWTEKISEANANANLFTIGGDTYAIVGDIDNTTNFANNTFDNGEIVVKLTGVAAATGEGADSAFISSILTFMNESTDQG